jgi:hypothetical protein
VPEESGEKRLKDRFLDPSLGSSSAPQYPKLHVPPPSQTIPETAKS